MEHIHVDVADLLVTAFEGGSNYWINSIELIEPSSKIGTPNFYARLEIVDMWNLDIKIKIDEPENNVFHLTQEGIDQGLNLLYTEEPYQYGLLLTEQWDANTADLFLQYALFEEIIYG